MVLRKTLSFAVVHFCVAFAVASWLTGSVLIGGTLALLEPAINTVAFFFHEQAWRRWQDAPRASLLDLPWHADRASLGMTPG